MTALATGPVSALFGGSETRYTHCDRECSCERQLPRLFRVILNRSSMRVIEIQRCSVMFVVRLRRSRTLVRESFGDFLQVDGTFGRHLMDENE